MEQCHGRSTKKTLIRFIFKLKNFFHETFSKFDRIASFTEFNYAKLL